MWSCFSKKKSTDGEWPWCNKILKWPSETSNQKPSSQAGETPNQQTSSQAGHQPKVWKLDGTHTRFGHLYGDDNDSIKELKDLAWEHLLQHTKPNGDQSRGDVMRNYESVIREVVRKAETEYSGQPNLNDFVKRLIYDGCYFLQLALLILERTDLHYCSDDLIMRRRDDRKWIEAMFFVGNQIPLVVLKKLMAQKFFKDRVSEVQEWTFPLSSLCKKALYELLVLPTLGKEGTALHQHASDILHGLQIMLIGAEIHVSGEHKIDIDTDEGKNERNFDSCATSLKNFGISIKKVSSGGIRSIHFQGYIFGACLYLPVLPVDDTTYIILKNLILYEKQRPRQYAEVSSYIRYMSELVQTENDARLLFYKNIVEGDFKKLPKILESLASEGCLEFTPHLIKVKNQTENFSATVTCMKKLISVVLLLTLIQSVCTLIQTVLALLEHADSRKH